MRCLDGLPPTGWFGPPTAVTVGVFDGIHIGHRALFDRTLRRAHELGGKAIVFTFRDHPDGVLQGYMPRPLQTLDERLAMMEQAGIDGAVLVEFTPQLQRMTAAEFAHQILDQGLGCRRLVLGYDSAICKHREGTVERFRELGLDAERFAQVTVEGMPLSSSAIRQALSQGHVGRARRMLGRDYTLRGEVLPGDARGREIGFPTANIAPPPLCLPATGVYAVRARFRGSSHPAVANIGSRPTVTIDAPLLIEVHVLDFEGDLYGQELEISFVARLRPEQRFSSLAELETQIARDVEQAAAILRAETAELDPRSEAT